MTKTNRTTDVTIKLKVKEGEKAKNSLGLTDPRLFTGENELHAIMDTQTCLWHCAYTSGILPRPFQQQFTSLTKLMTFVKEYYEKRNVEIEEVID